MNILITGVPGIGKTTVMEKLGGMLDRPAGFVTAEIRERGGRTGFSIRTFDGREAILAQRGKSPGPRVGPYTVFLDGLDSIGVHSIDIGIAEARVILIDEIGKMEAKSAAFKSAVNRALESDVDVVATLGVSAGPFLKSVRERPDVRLVEVTRSNRDELPARLVAMLESGH
jgi:nucleoside-triphosphatase